MNRQGQDPCQTADCSRDNSCPKQLVLTFEEKLNGVRGFSSTQRGGAGLGRHLAWVRGPVTGVGRPTVWKPTHQANQILWA
jgi:hypothetical protein